MKNKRIGSQYCYQAVYYNNLCLSNMSKSQLKTDVRQPILLSISQSDRQPILLSISETST